ncbi:MAG TPA: hypothetical protein VJM69_05430 [Dehalococcoidia bacterium]|nr:hypothetical protein [Dehalococcoidia bacterium]
MVQKRGTLRSLAGGCCREQGRLLTYINPKAQVVAWAVRHGLTPERSS